MADARRIVGRYVNEYTDLRLHSGSGYVTAKCRHKGLTTPAVADVLSPTLLDAAAAYWSQDLIGQVPGGDLPDWGAVTADLCPLLKGFLGQ